MCDGVTHTFFTLKSAIERFLENNSNVSYVDVHVELDIEVDKIGTFVLKVKATTDVKFSHHSFDDI